MGWRGRDALLLLSGSRNSCCPLGLRCHLPGTPHVASVAGRVEISLVLGECRSRLPPWPLPIPSLQPSEGGNTGVTLHSFNSKSGTREAKRNPSPPPCHSPGALVPGWSEGSTFQRPLMFVLSVRLGRFAMFSEKNKDKYVYTIVFHLQFLSLNPHDDLVR